MSLIALCTSLVLPGTAGWGLAGLLDVFPRNGPASVAGRLATAALFGIGLSSLSTFGWVLAGGTLGPGFALADGAAYSLLALGLSAFARHARVADANSGVAAPAETGRIGGIAMGAVLMAVVLALGATAVLGAASPHGEMDAWMMWNMRARFFFRAGTAWRSGFAPELGWTSTEYPLLLPLSIARIWAYAGESQAAPAVLASIFTAAAPMTLVAAVSARAEPWRGAVAGLLLVASPGYLSLGASQYADVPVAAYVVAAVGVLGVAGGTASSSARRVLGAGLLLGLAGWIKNEGVLAAAIVLAVEVVAKFARDGSLAAAKRLLLLAGGSAIPAVAWLVFHHSVMPRVTGALFLGHTVETMASRLTELARWRTVLVAMGDALPGARLGFPVVVIVFAAVFAWRDRRTVASRALAIALLFLFAQALVFMLTAWDLSWHLRLAADRVVLQAWPVLLLALLAGPACACSSAVTAE